MNISLTRELDTFVQEQLASGQYKSASEVVRDGLRILSKRQAKITFLENTLDTRLMDHERVPVVPDFWEDLREKAKTASPQS